MIPDCRGKLLKDCMAKFLLMATQPGIFQCFFLGNPSAFLAQTPKARMIFLPLPDLIQRRVLENIFVSSNPIFEPYKHLSSPLMASPDH
jgi:hypothetical protein